jgi:hypothetical protein
VVFLGASRMSEYYHVLPDPFLIIIYQSLYHARVYCLDTDSVVKKPTKRKRFVRDSFDRSTPLMPEPSAPKVRTLC